MLGSGMPWPGDEGDQRWEQAWMAIKKVCCPTIHTGDRSRHISLLFLSFSSLEYVLPV